MSVNGIELKEGQVWRTRTGHLVKIYKSEDPDFPWAGVNEFSKERVCYRDNGRWHENPKFDTARDLIKLAKDVPMKENNTFNPQPGDKIICNNGEEFICCNKDFLEEDGLAFDVQSDNIFAYRVSSKKMRQNKYDWQHWMKGGIAIYNNDYNIREVIPAESKEVVKEEEPRYSASDIQEAFNRMNIPQVSYPVFMGFLQVVSSKEYKEYLRLRATYE